MKDIDCADAGQKAAALGIFAGAFSYAAMKLVVAKEPAPETPAAELVSELREMTCLHE